MFAAAGTRAPWRCACQAPAAAAPARRAPRTGTAPAATPGALRRVQRARPPAARDGARPPTSATRQAWKQAADSRAAAAAPPHALEARGPARMRHPTCGTRQWRAAHCGPVRWQPRARAERRLQPPWCARQPSRPAGREARCRRRAPQPPCPERAAAAPPRATARCMRAGREVRDSRLAQPRPCPQRAAAAPPRATARCSWRRVPRCTPSRRSLAAPPAALAGCCCNGAPGRRTCLPQLPPLGLQRQWPLPPLAAHMPAQPPQQRTPWRRRRRRQAGRQRLRLLTVCRPHRRAQGAALPHSPGSGMNLRPNLQRRCRRSCSCQHHLPLQRLFASCSLRDAPAPHLLPRRRPPPLAPQPPLPPRQAAPPHPCACSCHI